MWLKQRYTAQKQTGDNLHGLDSTRVAFSKLFRGSVLLLWNDPILLSCQDSQLTGTSSLFCPSAVSFIQKSQRENPCAGNCPHTRVSLLWGSSVEWAWGCSWNRSVRAVCAGDDCSGLPVWLVKVDAESSSPVWKHRFLCNETVMASSSTSLVGKVHGAFVRPWGLIVMIRHSGMGGGSSQEKRGKAWKGKKVKVRGRDGGIVWR